MAAPPPPPPPPSGGGKKKKLTPAQSAARSQATAQARAKLRASQGNPSNPYVTIKNGKIVTTNSAGALKIFGQPVTRSELLRYWTKYNDLWLNYLGRPITARELNEFVNKGWSQYQIVTNYLVNRPNFTKSPVWKNRSPDYSDVWHQVYGDNSTPDQAAIRYAIVNNLNTGAFHDYLKQRADYHSSQEYQGNFASLSTVYQRIFGLPDVQGDQLIAKATNGSWSQDQFASWLRQTPEWKSSDEAQGLYQGLVQRFGLLPQTGGQTALAPAGPIASVNPSAIPGGDTAPATSSPGAP